MPQNQNFNPFEFYPDFGILKYLSERKNNRAKEKSIFVKFCLKSSVSEEKFIDGLQNLLRHELIEREVRGRNNVLYYNLTDGGENYIALLKKNFGRN